MVQTLEGKRDSLPAVGVLSIETYFTLWPQISTQLQTVKHLWEPWYSLEYLRVVQNMGWEVWGAHTEGTVEVVVYTIVAQYPSKTVFQIPFMFGRNLRKYIPVLEAQFTKIAADLECDEIEIIGRPGWGRIFNVKPIAHVFRRPIIKIRVH